MDLKVRTVFSLGNSRKAKPTNETIWLSPEGRAGGRSGFRAKKGVVGRDLHIRN